MRGELMAKKTARRAKPKTAYELLERVCEAITANPLNYYQGFWKARRGARGSATVCALPEELDKPANECGTAFCRAGWIVALHDGINARPRDFDTRARAIMGFPRSGSFDECFGLFDGGAVYGTPGTRHYARQGASGVREFMKRHAEHLKAQKVSPKV
jgi:hypothetical protein